MTKSVHWHLGSGARAVPGSQLASPRNSSPVYPKPTPRLNVPRAGDGSRSDQISQTKGIL
jgi:hypothetical protein